MFKVNFNVSIYNYFMRKWRKREIKMQAFKDFFTLKKMNMMTKDRS